MPSPARGRAWEKAADALGMWAADAVEKVVGLRFVGSAILVRLRLDDRDGNCFL